MENKRQRRLPRHVDGRIKVGVFPIKQFLIFLPMAILIIVFTIKFFSPVTLPLGILFLGFTAMGFAEINNKETGLQIIIETIKYLIQGDKDYERSMSDVPIHKKLIINKKVQEIESRKHRVTD